MASSAESMEDQHRSLRDWNLLRRNRKASNTPKLSAKLANPDKTVCFVSIDAGMGSDLLNTRVVKRLEELMPPQEGESGKRLCHLENLSIRYETNRPSGKKRRFHCSPSRVQQRYPHAFGSGGVSSIHNLSSNKLRILRGNDGRFCRRRCSGHLQVSHYQVLFSRRKSSHLQWSAEHTTIWSKARLKPPVICSLMPTSIGPRQAIFSIPRKNATCIQKATPTSHLCN